MADIVNLRTVRKRKAKSDKEALAEQNRAKFGQTKTTRQQTESQKAQDSSRLDGHKRED